MVASQSLNQGKAMSRRRQVSWIDMRKHGRLYRDVIGAVLGWSSVDFGSSMFVFNFSPTAFRFGDPKLIGFGFGFLFYLWMPNGGLKYIILNKNSVFY
jgi:hypothetical protein